MDHIITDIENRLAEKITDLKYVGQDWGQLSLYDKDGHPPVKFPCALIDIQGGQFSNTGNLVQEGLLTIVITVADWSQLVSFKAPTAMKDMENRIFKLLGNCYTSLHGWSGTQDYTGLSRTNTGRMIRQDGLRMRTITFTTNWQDISASRVYNRIAPPSVSVKASFLP